MNADKGKIKFLVSRDFGETFNVSIKFLRQNFKPFFGALLFIAGPVLITSALLDAYYESLILYKQSLVRAGRLYRMNEYTWHYFASKLFLVISHLTIICTTHSFMIVYDEKGPGNVTVKDVKNKLFNNIGNITKSFSIYLLLIIIFGVALGALFIAFSKSNIGIGILFFIAIFCAIIILGPNAFWRISCAFIVIIKNQGGALSAFEKTKEVRHDNFWWTWLIAICTNIITSVIGILFLLPVIIYAAIQQLIPVANSETESFELSITYILIYTLCGFFAFVINSFNHLVFGFHYYSLLEKQEGLGMLERINDIGKDNKQNVEEQF